MNDKNLTSEKRSQPKYQDIKGYVILSNPLCIAMSAIFASITFTLTMIAVLLSEGFINIGDLGVMISGVLCGPIVGFIAGGIGPLIADLILFPPTALFTLIIKALEGLVIGIIANPRKNYKKLNYRDIIALIVGGLIMVFGYFFVELLIFRNPGWAFTELPFNFFIQFLVGVIGSIFFIKFARKNIIDSLPQVFDKIFIPIELESNS